ncbi:DUF2867 domain-containing protein [Nocardia bovistercoris]|uniref:DUF2867 domain-containing protein n=1 Tax=Nocardia bovistercoris TaxID=2785916 RepID=A0A931N4T5_9NOCA|nr:DUF2867 domain-containing protein [Nocardia bovistercoris]MBH0777953.1 DUF2867 domain-containing protein [Nocardia bovistercoris]
MRIPISVFTDQPWRVHAVAPDFDVADVWLLPASGGPRDLDRLVEVFTSDNGDDEVSFAYRALFAIRWRLGALFGWDDEDAGIGARVRTLRDRLPEDLRDGPRGPEFRTLPFTPVYRTESEWLAEIANATVHAAMHIGWVPDASGGYHGQMAVLVKPNGLLGRLYMAAILPFRYLFVYPALMKLIERAWQRDSATNG